MGHRFHGVLNNPTDLEINRLMEMSLNKEVHQIKFIYYKAHEHQKTYHYHIYIEYKVKRGFQYMKFMLPRAHWEVCNKDREHNIMYIDHDEHDKRDINGQQLDKWKKPMKLKKYDEEEFEMERMPSFVFDEATIKGWDAPDQDLLSIEEHYDPAYKYIKC